MMQFLINPTDCNTFELEMISNAKIEGLLMPNSIETNKYAQYSIIYEKPVGKKTLKELLDEDFFDSNRYHDLLCKIIKLKIRLENYMLNSHKLYFCMDGIWYDPVLSDYQFIYLPDSKTDALQELNLYRHIFIESFHNFEKNSNLLCELKQNSFDLDHLCTSLNNSNTKKKSRRLWRKIIHPKEQSRTLESNTIQKTRKSCLLDALNPTVIYEIYFTHNTVGRSDECNIRIDNPSISRRHAVICKNKLEFTIEDLDSSNGTFHNEKPIKDTVKLVNGDKLQFGDKEFIFIQ